VLDLVAVKQIGKFGFHCSLFRPGSRRFRHAIKPARTCPISSSPTRSG